MNTAIIAAAGTGERLGSEIPKQFIEILGKPLIIHTVERFDAAPSVDSIILVLPAEWVEWFDAHRQGLSKVRKVLSGRGSRAGSVYEGLKGIESACEIVAVHDGARPLVSVGEIESTIERAKEVGAACLVAPVTDTIKSVAGGEILRTLDRTKLRRALTPQVFRRELLSKAFEAADLDDNVTDECYLVEKLGHPIAIVEGRPANIKVTYPEDVILAESMMRSERTAFV